MKFTDLLINKKPSLPSMIYVTGPEGERLTVKLSRELKTEALSSGFGMRIDDLLAEANKQLNPAQLKAASERLDVLCQAQGQGGFLRGNLG